MTMELTGHSFIGNQRGTNGGAGFHGANPQTGSLLEPVYHSAISAEVEQAIQLAAEAFPSYSQTPGKAPRSLSAPYCRRI